jgi:hypothetical protein
MTVVSVHGPKGSGKSKFGSTWPGRKFWMDLEKGAERGLHSVSDWKETNTLWHPADDGMADALIQGLTFNKGGIYEGQIQMWEAIVKKYVEQVRADTNEVLLADTWKEVWRTNCRAYLQFLQENPSKTEIQKGERRKQLMARDYGTPNDRMEGFIQAAKAFNKDLILISHERDEYVPGTDQYGNAVDVPSGKKVLDSYKHTEDAVDWSFHSSFEIDCTLNLVGNGIKHECQGFHFKLKIEKSPVGAHLVGVELENPTYDRLMDLIEKMKPA